MAGREKTPPKKRGRKPILSTEMVAAVLAKNHGNIAATARHFNVERASVRDFIGRHPALQQVLSDAREGMLDDVESALYRAALDGEGWAVCFFLKTQGKTRGYGDRAPELDESNKAGERLAEMRRLSGLLATMQANADADGTQGTSEGGSTVGGAERPPEPGLCEQGG
jgi:hypothetical protein